MFNRKVVLVLRSLFGVLLLLIGLINVTQDSTLPDQPAAAAAFEQAVIDTGYILKIVGVVELIVGVLLISNRFAALALVALFPVSVNFLAFKLFAQDWSTFWPAVLYFAFNVYLMWAYKDAYAPLLRSKLDSPTS